MSRFQRQPRHDTTMDVRLMCALSLDFWPSKRFRVPMGNARTSPKNAELRAAWIDIILRDARRGLWRT